MSRSKVLPIVLSLVGLVGPACMTSTPKKVVVVPPIASEGLYGAPRGACSVRLSRSNMGGFLVLSLVTGAESDEVGELAADVTGVAWADDETVVFTTSPVYGSPGLFLWRCGATEPRRLVGAAHRSPAYPQGSDYFELVRLEIDDAPRAVFLMTPNVDTTDFALLRQDPSYLFQVQLEGGGLAPHSLR